MLPEIGFIFLRAARPLLDLAPPRTPTPAQGSGLVDMAAGTGIETALVGAIAGAVGVVLVFILRARRR